MSRRCVLTYTLLVACWMLPLLCALANENANAVGGASVPAPKLVSLAPSNTELIYSLGAEKQLLAVSDVCDYPPAAKTRLKAGSFVNAKVELITMIKPDHVLLVTGQEAIAATLRARGIGVLVLKNEHLADVSTNLIQLGKITGQTARATKLSSSFDNCLVQLKTILAKAKSHPRVFFCVWPEPLITAGAGSFLHEVATTCGAVNIAESLPAAYPRMNVERIITGKPEILIMASQAKEQDFWKKPPWTSTPAFRAGKIYFLPEADKDPLARPTLRIVEGLFWLADKVHPELHLDLERWVISSRNSLSH